MTQVAGSPDGPTVLPPPPGELRRVAEEAALPRLGIRPNLGRYLAQLYQRRHFTVELARSRFAARTQGDRLGYVWLVLRPLLQAAIYGTVFAFLLPSSTRPDNFVAFLVAGVFLFTYFSAAVTNGARAITGDAGLVRAIHFPRALLPIATVLIELMSMGPVLVVLLLICLITGEGLSWEWLLLVPAMAVFTLFNFGVAFLCARITTAARDFTQLLPFVLRILFYVSGVFYELARYDSIPWISTLLQANPVHVYLTLVREALLDDRSPTLSTWAYGTAWALVVFVGGFLFFWRAEDRYGRG